MSRNFLLLPSLSLRHPHHWLQIGIGGGGGGGPGIRYHCPGPKRKSHRGKYNKTHRGRIKLSNSCESAPNCWPFVGSLKWKAEGKGVGLRG